MSNNVSVATPRSSLNWAMVLASIFIGLSVAVGTDIITGLFTTATTSAGDFNLINERLSALKDAMEAGNRELRAVIDGRLNTLDSRVSRVEQDILLIQRNQ